MSVSSGAVYEATKVCMFCSEGKEAEKRRKQRRRGGEVWAEEEGGVRGKEGAVV